MHFARDIVRSVLITCVTMLVFSCDEPRKPEMPVSDEELKEKLMDLNRQRVGREKVNIDSIARSWGWEYTATGTGLRYEILSKGEGDSIRTDQLVKLEYVITFLNGDTVYTSDENGPHEFRVGMDHVETGIHEAMGLMNNGDQARLILPAHLAHGFMGDERSIPGNTALVYYIKIVDAK